MALEDRRFDLSVSSLEAGASLEYPSLIIISDDVSNFAKLADSLGEERMAILRGAVPRIEKPGQDAGSSIEFLAPYASAEGGGGMQRVCLCLLPTAVARNNTAARPHALAALVLKHKSASEAHGIVLLPSNGEWAIAQGLAAAKHFPKYCAKQASTKKIKAGEKQAISILVDFGAGLSAEEKQSKVLDLQSLVHSLRLCQELVDLPPNVLNCSTYVEAATEVATSLASSGVTFTCIRGNDLKVQGFGGLYGVGKASEHPPALFVLSHPGSSSQPGLESVCLVGKGIVYDTGGLSIKVPPGMAGMKNDMGGSAAVLTAFKSIVERGGLARPLHALLCIAENSVDERATRPDDVHLLLSGKTVEVNNTDAEGRLVLSDGVFFAYRDLKPAYIIDIATLTGAQLVVTGLRHAALFCNDEELEATAMLAGKATGDLTFPTLYCPEFHRPEFSSTVADMKNSVANRMNAQASCAGQFIGNHLEEYLQAGGKWCHIDMAGPCNANFGDRSTGYGTALLFELARRLGN